MWVLTLTSRLHSTEGGSLSRPKMCLFPPTPAFCSGLWLRTVRRPRVAERFRGQGAFPPCSPRPPQRLSRRLSSSGRGSAWARTPGAVGRSPVCRAAPLAATAGRPPGDRRASAGRRLRAGFALGAVPCPAGRGRVSAHAWRGIAMKRRACGFKAALSGRHRAVFADRPERFRAAKIKRE